MSNQFAGPIDFADHDSSVRPGFILLWLAVPAIWILLALYVLVAVLALGPLPQARLNAPEQVLLALGLLPIPVILPALTVSGWMIGFVPFTPYPPDTPLRDESALPEGQPVRLGLTGIVALAVPRIRRRYRHRPTVLVFQDGNINLLVDRWRTGYFHRQRSYAAVVRLDPGSVSAVVRGTAFLVSGEMPAIRAATQQGMLILAFPTPDSRDRVFNALVAVTSGSPVRTTTTVEDVDPGDSAKEGAPDLARAHEMGDRSTGFGGGPSQLILRVTTRLCVFPLGWE